GGPNAAYMLGAAEMEALASRLCATAKAKRASLLVTPSRRTGEENLRILKDKLADVPHFLWEGEGDNPYFGLLGLADFLVTTSDSVNMISEAASTGKPVYVVHLPGGSRKFDRFHEQMRADGIVRDFGDALELYSYAPLNDMTTVVARVKALFSS